jgi:polar amino acid transport system permease protein
MQKVHMGGFLQDMIGFLPALMKGIQLTIIVTIGSLVFSTVLGLVWAIMRLSTNRALSWTSATIVNLLRAIPILVQLFYIYFVLPELGVALTALQAAIIGLGIAYSSYQAEDFRAGIEAVDHGQTEAAQSIGMSRSLMMRRVILPQAVRIILPSYGNTMIMMLKDSSLASTITVAELSLQGKLLASSTFKNTAVFTTVALLYLVMCLPLMGLSRWLEKRMGRRR